jgi:protein SCO1/2
MTTRAKNMLVLIAVFVVLLALGWYLYQTYMVEKLPVLKAGEPFEYTNLDGQQVSLESTNGKVRLMYYFYSSCPDVCLPTTHLLSKVQGYLKEEGTFGEDTAILSITFDPENDTPERLKEVAASNPVQADLNGWYFLRGDEENVIQTAEKYGVYIQRAEGGLYAHSNYIILLDDKGNIRKYYNANDIELEPEDIAKDMIRLSL